MATLPTWVTVGVNINGGVEDVENADPRSRRRRGVGTQHCQYLTLMPALPKLSFDDFYARLRLELNKMHRNDTSDESEVISRERLEIRRRRAAALFDDSEVETATPLVGMSISGGGIRSGAVGLGFLQGMIRHRALKFVDYLSTVSGGGYVGAFLSSFALNQDTGLAGFDNKSSGEVSDKEFGQQPKRILNLVYSSDYLRHMTAFANRSVLGSVLILCVMLSGLICLTSLIAFIHQCVNYREFRHAIAILGFDSDILAAFLPTTFFAIVWLLIWFVAFWRGQGEASGRLARPFLGVTALTTATACAMLLGTGDISLGHVSEWMGVGSTAIRPDSWSRPLLAGILGAVIAAIVPYFKPKLLIRSGTNPRSIVERLWYWIATRALVVGVPFLLIVFFAQEDIAGKNASRVPYLKRKQEIAEWKRETSLAPFWIHALADTSILGEKLREAKFLSGASQTEPQFDLYQSLNRIDEKCNEYVRENQEVGFLRQWSNLVFAPFEYAFRDATEFRRNSYVRSYSLKCEIETMKNAMLEPVNSFLRNPSLYKEMMIENKCADEWIDGELEDNRLLPLADAVREARLLHLSLLKGGPKPISSESDELQVTAESKRQRFQSDSQAFRELQNQIVRNNRIMLGLYYPNTLQPASVAFSASVLHDDQEFRLSVFLVSGIVFLLSGFFVDLNATSIHKFYAKRLADAWIDPSPGVGRRIPLAQLDTAGRGYPYHLITGSAYFPGRRNRDEHPEPFDYFLFSREFCGSERTQFSKTEKFMGGKYSLDDAMAISGGATSVLHLTRNPLLTTILLVLNVRLGQWVENPGFSTRIPKFLSKYFEKYSPISPIRVLISLARRAERRSLCFVADGGFFDNLGLDSLIRRRCRLIISVDAGADPSGDFSDFIRLVRYARMKHNVAIYGCGATRGLPFDSLTPKKETAVPEAPLSKTFSKAHCFFATIEYPDAENGLLLYVKSTMTGDEPDELLKYHEGQEQFPHDTTLDQAFLPSKFESYRLLGDHIADGLFSGIFEENGKGADAVDSVESFITRVRSYCEKQS